MNQEDASRLVNESFESLSAFLMRYAMRGVGSTAVAEDIVQEAFLALYRSLREGKQIDDPRAWLFGAVRNQVRKVSRTHRLRREELVAPEDFDLMSSADWNEGVPAEDLAPEALEILSPREEEVILLRLQSMKYREIGECLGISSKSVCTLLARAIKKLQSLRQSQEIGERPTRRPRREFPHALQ